LKEEYIEGTFKCKTHQSLHCGFGDHPTTLTTSEEQFCSLVCDCSWMFLFPLLMRNKHFIENFESNFIRNIKLQLQRLIILVASMVCNDSLYFYFEISQ
jgi:hypothetical protein